MRQYRLVMDRHAINMHSPVPISIDSLIHLLPNGNTYPDSSFFASLNPLLKSSVNTEADSP